MLLIQAKCYYLCYGIVHEGIVPIFLLLLVILWPKPGRCFKVQCIFLRLGFGPLLIYIMHIY